MVRKHNFPSRLVKAVWGEWQTNELWQRILKYALGCTVATIVSILPATAQLYGVNSFLVPMTTVFAHPGQRMGVMIESLFMIILGTLVGTAWSILGLYLSSLTREPAAYTIRALFLLVSVLAHGFIRSKSPRLFNFVLFMLIGSLLVDLGKAHVVTLRGFTDVAYPVLSGGAILLVVNLTVFPELSSSYLGTATIETLQHTTDALDQATYWFITPGGDSEGAREKQKAANLAARKKRKRRKGWIWRFLDDFPNPFKLSTAKRYVPMPLDLITLAGLTDKKSKLRAQLVTCKTAQNEVNYEISISPLAPMALKRISTKFMSRLVQDTVSLIGSCENKFLLLENREEPKERLGTGPEHADGHLSIPQPSPSLWHQLATARKLSTDGATKNPRDYKRELDKVKPTREIMSGSVELLEHFLDRLRPCLERFGVSKKEATNVLFVCLAYCFDLHTLPSGAPTPKGIPLEEIDLCIDTFTDALDAFDRHSSEELKQVTLSETGMSVDFMPRTETFLVSSFLLSYRQTATHILAMLRHARELVETRQCRNDRLGLWMPYFVDIRHWLSTGGEADGIVLTHNLSRTVRKEGEADAGSFDTKEVHSPSRPVSLEGVDNEGPSELAQNESGFIKSEKRQGCPEGSLQKRSVTRWGRCRENAADVIEWVQRSEDLAYALKLAIAVFLTSWPGFVTSWNSWYAEVRGVWAPMQLVLVFEVAIGTSLFVFLVRLFGVVFGCVVGYLSYEIGRGNRIAMMAILVLGIVPSIYIQLGTKYVKAGMISIVSMVVVALAALGEPESATESFYKRLVAFLVGGLSAVVVEVFIYPVRARDRLVESLSASVRHVSNMQTVVYVGVDGPEKPNFRSKALNRRFDRSRYKAQAALAAAEAFLPFCSTEPRLKGSFKPLAPIYREVIYVLHQIIDRMDNVVQLRREHGSSILEDLNSEVYAYRRNVAASSMLMLFSVNEALTAWLPLPQFLPSARLAQLRFINQVRQVICRQKPQKQMDGLLQRSAVNDHVADIITQRKFLSWNATAAGQMETIEYLEELIELVKLLVGVNAFRSGMLERPQYRQYVQEIKKNRIGLDRVYPARSHIPASQQSQSSQGPVERSIGERLSSQVTLDTEEGGRTASLGRTVTTASNVSRFVRRLASGQSARAVPELHQSPEPVEDNSSDDDEGEEVLPVSLQRVGMRMQQENAAIRRKGYDGYDDG